VVIVPAEDGSAQFTYVPAEAGWHTITVYATYANGGVSGKGYYSISAI
jgi:hypothetical protein